jgi:inhibitor of KinA sporulation pathway (predicted exonuclease)
MIRIALDLEMEQPCNTIIQIGACAFNSKTGEIIENFCQFIKLGKPLSEYIRSLTGITDAQLETGTDLVTAYHALISFHKKHDTHRQLVCWGAGDGHALRRQLFDIKPDLDWELGRTEMNVKNLHQAIMEANEVSLQGGLAKSMTRHGIHFQGTKHDAVHDSVNTARLYCHLLKNLRYR